MSSDVDSLTELAIGNTGGGDRYHIIDMTGPTSKYITQRNSIKLTFTVDDWIGAKDFMIRADNGVTSITKTESSVNKVNYLGANFDTTTEENIQFEWVPRRNWNAGTVTAIFYWDNTAGLTTETVAWGIKGVAIGNDGAVDSAFGSEITTSDTWLAQNDIHISAASAAITIAGATDTDYAVFNVARKVASDDMTGDVRLIGVRLIYTVTDLASS